MERKLGNFAKAKGIAAYFDRMAVNAGQVEAWALPTRAPKRVTAADKRWPYDFACELDAIPPDQLRTLVWDKLEQYIPESEMNELKAAEESERDLLRMFARHAAKPNP
jgi:hypothetical protein